MGLRELDEFEAGTEENSKSLNSVYIPKNFKSRLRFDRYDYVSGKIEMDMYDYMIKNHDKVMSWIVDMANTPTCYEKFRVLQAYTYHSAEDLISETYMRVLRTFYNNKKRLEVCKNCNHQCKEFLEKTKKTNTEKYASGKKCIPYMFYNYSEKAFHNYINHSLKCNIDIKLKKINNDQGERMLLSLSEKSGTQSDACELGALISEIASIDGSSELREELLNKRLIMEYDLEPMYRDGSSPLRKRKKQNGKTQSAYWAEIHEIFQEESPEDADLIELAQEDAFFDMTEFMPNQPEFLTYIPEGEEYYDYLYNQSTETPKMVYDPKDTRVSIVEENFRFIPLPCTVYATCSIRDFIELALDSKLDLREKCKVFLDSQYQSTFKEIWVDLDDGKCYNIKQTTLHTDSIFTRRERVKLLLESGQTNLASDMQAQIPEFSTTFINKVCKHILDYAKTHGLSQYASAQKITMSVRKRVVLTEEERRERANAQYKAILDLKESILNNEIHHIDTSKVDTMIPNLKSQELYNSILEKVPTQELRYVKEKIKVVCTNQVDSSSRSVVSI